MTHSAKKRAFSLALLLGLAVSGHAHRAEASSAFPASLQKALTKQFPGITFCVPLCTACHTTTAGGPGRHNVFGDNLFLHGHLAPAGTDPDKQVQDAIQTYFAATPGPTDKQVNGKWDSDGDGVSDEDELKALSSPSLPLPRGEHEFCPDIAYGCGARVAPVRPSVDAIALFSAALAAALGLTLALRRRRGGQSTGN